MHQLEFFGKKAGNIDAGPPKKMQLFEKLPERTASFVIHIRLRNQTAFETCPDDTDAVLNVFAHTGDNKAADPLIHLARQTHVKRTGVESAAQRLLFAPNAARRKRRSHGVADGLLHRVEVRTGRIRTAVQVVSVLIQVIINGLEVMGRNDAVGVENHEVVALRLIKTEIARKTLSTIVFEEIPDVQPVGKRFHDVTRLVYRTVFNNQHLKIPVCLLGQGVQQFPDFIGTVVERNDNGILSRH